ncbi:MAG TPA: MBL fold metallo-hydrolase, partial [Trueperaceae bacterium]
MTHAGGLHYARTQLLPGVELYVYALPGKTSRILIDSGTRAMRAAILALGRDIGGLDKVLLTHIHADHIGCCRTLQQAGATILAPGAVAWLENP